MEKIFPFLLVGIVIVVKVLPLILKANRQEQEGWKEEAPPPPRPVGKKAVSGPDALTQIMQQFNQMQEQKTAPPVLPTRKPPPPEEAPAPAEAPRKRYLTAESLETPPMAKVQKAKGQKAKAEKQAKASRPPIERQTSKVAGDALDAAFPGKKKRKAKPKKTKKTSLRGRENLRKAIILGEMIGPPRSFDV